MEALPSAGPPQEVDNAGSLNVSGAGGVLRNSLASVRKDLERSVVQVTGVDDKLDLGQLGSKEDRVLIGPGGIRWVHPHAGSRFLGCSPVLGDGRG